MTGRRLIRQPSRWQAERADELERQHREAVAVELSATLPLPLTDAQILAFTGAAELYVRSSSEARAHAYATGVAAVWHDATGALIVAVDELGAVVELGPGRWPS